MNVLTKIYWTRVGLGAAAGLVSTAVSYVWEMMSGVTIQEQVLGEGSTNTLLNGITVALLIYLVGYYLMKARYASKIEKQSKIMTMGIFIYFFTWLLVWVLTLTIGIGPIEAAPAAII
ncbi:MAG: hypothetical protein NWF04_03500 [Candidatus Bathyarchaeota archaeon]|nr:hypothetical protein [Candidatus Bathyarchaeota archaeon]